MREKVQSPGLLFSGKIVEAVSKEPVSKYHLRLFEVDEEDQSEPKLVTERDIEDEDGRFGINIDHFGYYKIEVSSRGYATRLSWKLPLLSEEDLHGLEMLLLRVAGISGRVIDDETGEPIQGAIVGLAQSHHEDDMNRSPVELLGENRTDRDGAFIFEDLRRFIYHVFALHPDYKEGFVKTKTGQDPIEIRLIRAGPRIFGNVHDDSGESLEGLAISFRSKLHPEERYVLTDPDGFYTSPPLPEGRIKVSAGCTRGYTSPKFTPEQKWVELEEHDVELNFGPSSEFAVWQGYLIGWDGLPIPEGIIHMYSHGHFKEYPFQMSYLRAICDEKGYFEVPKIPLGKYSLDLRVGSKFSRGYPLDPIEFPEQGIHYQDIKLPHTEISGCVIVGSTNEKARRADVTARLRSVEVRKSFSTYTDENGFYSFQGLPPGKYSLDAKDHVSCAIADIAWSHPKVELEEGQVLSNQDIVIPTSGLVSFTILGLDKLKGKDFRVRFFYENEQESCWGMGIYRFPETMYKEKDVSRYNIAPGRWTMKIYIVGGEVLVEKVFVVNQDQEMEIEVDLNKILPLQNPPQD
jgi:protocatechuate 3,4-dioxygenase beta subunit